MGRWRRPRPRRATGRRWTAAAGLVLLVAGVGVLGWVGWQLYGTTVVAQRRHDQIVAALEQRWSSGKELVRSDAGPARSVVRVPRFGSEYAVPVLDGTSEAALAAGFGRFEGAAAAGEVGNFALAGHRITHGEPLRDMADLRPGDRVVVETAEATFTYVLDTGGEALVVPFTAGWVLDPLPTNPEGGVQPPDRSLGQRLIRLTTCSELFHTDDRWVAFGHLLTVRERESA